MNPDMHGEARKKTLEELMQAMGGMDAARLKPAVSITIATGPDAGEVEGSPEEEAEETPSEESAEHMGMPGMGGMDPRLAELVRKKRGMA